MEDEMVDVPAEPSGSSVSPPTAPAFHGVLPRGLETTPSSSSTTGRFGRMFRNVPVFEHPVDALVALGRAMIEPVEAEGLDKPLAETDADENEAKLPDGELRLPAGYTYLGQFVDHDITFDPVSSLTRQNDPDALTDFRTPRFDLDSLYGRGPSDQPYLYEGNGLKLALGDARPAAGGPFSGPYLQRGAGGRALIGDPRNDENRMVSQLHVAFIKFHNAVVETHRSASPAMAEPDLFKLAQHDVRWHYQWVVVHDYLSRLVGDHVIADLLKKTTYHVPGGEKSTVVWNGLFYHWREQPFMPVEFSVAAYRFGHSMARPTYLINDDVKVPVVTNAHRIPLFLQKGATEKNNLSGFRRLPTGWGVQWKYFLPGTNDVPGENDAFLPQPSYKIDAELGPALGALPASVAQPEDLFAGISAEAAQSLAVRNLLRGRALGVPAGQDVARAMGIEPLSDERLHEGVEPDATTRSLFAGRHPLWFYILREAKLTAGAAHLGPVGGRIVAEVLVGLLAGDPLSYLNVSPNWKPWLPSRRPHHFTLTDIVNLGLGDQPA